MNGESPFARLVETPEHALVEAVFADQILVQHLGVPPQMRGPFEFRLRVRPEALGIPCDAFGDADAVLVQERDHGLARAVEFKRMKISGDALLNGRVSKLPELTKAARQVNALHRAGFAFVWLTVIVVADMRPVTRGVGFAAPPLHLIDQVREALPVSDIAPDIGITICEISQVSDEPANERGGSGGQLLRLAAGQTQPRQLTAGLRELFATPVAT